MACGYLTALILITYVVLPPALSLNSRPIIGILAQESKSTQGDTFIPASYVKYLEQAGARVVPIRAKEAPSYYKKLFSYINGALFPGGAAGLVTSEYAKSGRHIYDLAIEANDNGDFFPLWGTCQGFQLLSNLTAHHNLLQATDSFNMCIPLDFAAGYKNSRLMGQLPPDIYSILSQEDVTVNLHHYSLLYETFKKYSELNKFYRLLSTNKGRKGKVFVSSFEAYKYPFYGIQWHPEKINYVWNLKYDINHGPNAIKISQYFANFFVNEARKSGHRFPSNAIESESVIENFKRVYQDDGTFGLLYFFNYTHSTL